MKTYKTVRRYFDNGGWRDFEVVASGHNSTDMYISGSIHDRYLNYEVKASTRKPSKVVTALFLALKGGELRRSQLNEIFATVNNHHTKHGYCDSTLAYHANLGRLNKERRGTKSFFSLTDKGIKYAQDRGIFEVEMDVEF